MKSRRKFTSEFKVKVDIEALKEKESINVLSRRFLRHPNQIIHWKKEFLSKAAIIFTDAAVPRVKSDDREIQKLYEVIGQQKVEIDFLKKVLSRKPVP